MRLALAGPFPPYRGGIAQFTGMLAGSLERYGDTVERISFSRMYPSILFPGRSQTDDSSPCSISSLKLLDSVNPLKWSIARKKLREMKPDGILVQWWHPFFSPCLNGSIPPEIPSVSICHNILPHESFPLGRLLTRLFLRRQELTVTHSIPDTILARELSGSDNSMRLYLPIYEQYTMSTVSRSEARRKLGYSDDDRVLLFFGLIRAYKGVSDLAEATTFLDESVKLLIVGECYSDSRDLRRELADPRLEGRVVWVDSFVPDIDVATYFRAADLVVLPYRHATQSAVAQTALGFRKPLILTDTGGLAEVIDDGKTGFLVPPGDPEALAEGIRNGLELATESDLEERIAVKAREFSWEDYVRRLRERWP